MCEVLIENLRVIVERSTTRTVLSHAIIVVIGDLVLRMPRMLARLDRLRATAAGPMSIANLASAWSSPSVGTYSSQRCSRARWSCRYACFGVGQT